MDACYYVLQGPLWCPVVKNPPCDAGALGSIPCCRTKIPHAAGQLSPHAKAREKPAHSAMKNPSAATKTWCSQKEIEKNML